MALPFSYSGIALRMPGRPQRKGISGTRVLTGHGFVSKRGASRLPVTCGGAGGVVRCARGEWENGNARLEEEVFEFMEASQRPNHFPTKEELLRSGRADLVHAIVAHGGWLAAGWDSEEAGSIHVNSHDADVDDDDSVDDEYEDEEDGLVEPQQNRPAQNTIDVSAEVVSDKSGSEESGIAAMLTRLERERMLSYSEASTGRKGNGGQQSNGCGEPWLQPSSVNSERKVEERSFRGKETLQSLRRESPPAAYENTDLDFRENLVKPKRWGIPGVRQIEDLEIGTEGELDVSGPLWQSSRGIEQISPQTVHINDNTTEVADKFDEIIDKRQEWTWNFKASYSGHSHQIYSRDVPNTIMSRIQKLEGQLVSALGSLRSGKDGLDKNKVDDKKVFEELEKASDALEFRETEIMKMRAKLRSTRAKLAALEGKMAMEIMEVRKAFEEKQKKVEEAHKVLSLLRTARIVWPNSATEVFLAGSFDGWTSQRKMGKSNAGVFVISLQLYPGRYEIKFIVDGVWKVDPQRPVVYDNGFENNLLVIY